MATVGQFYWPSVGTFVAAYGQFFMAANRARPERDRSLNRVAAQPLKRRTLPFYSHPVPKDRPHAHPAHSDAVRSRVPPQ